MATVYLAEDLKHQRRVELYPERDALEARRDALLTGR